MAAEIGRRESNKQQTRRAIRGAAMDLFRLYGFEQVTTTQIAQAAGVSPATVFNHFATKEDLCFGQVRQLERELAALVASVPPGESILTALRDHVMYELTAGRADRKPTEVGTFHALVAASASLRAREAEIYERRAGVLTTALVETGQDQLTAQVAARQYVAAEQLIAAELRRRLVGRRSTRRALAELDPFVQQVFELLRTGLGELRPVERDRPDAQQPAIP